GGERGLQPRQCLASRLWTWSLVLLDTRRCASTAGDLDWHDLGLEAALIRRRHGALVTPQRALVLLLTGDAAAFGDRLGAHAHVVVVPGRPQTVVHDGVL